MLKKVAQVAVLRSVFSDLGRDSVYNNEMHSARFQKKRYDQDYDILKEFVSTYEVLWKGG